MYARGGTMNALEGAYLFLEKFEGRTVKIEFTSAWATTWSEWYESTIL